MVRITYIKLNQETLSISEVIKALASGKVVIDQSNVILRLSKDGLETVDLDLFSWVKEWEKLEGFPSDFIEYFLTKKVMV